MKTAEVGLYGSVPRRATRITRVTSIGYSSPVPRLELGIPFPPRHRQATIKPWGVDPTSRFHQQGRRTSVGRFALAQLFRILQSLQRTVAGESSTCDFL